MRNRTSRDPISQRRPIHEFHHEGMSAVRIFKAKDVRNIRVIECGEDFRFAVETGETVGIARHDIWQDFHGHVAFELRVPRAIDLAHTARAEGGEDLVRAKARAGLEGHGDLTGLYLPGFRHLREFADSSIYNDRWANTNRKE